MSDEATERLRHLWLEYVDATGPGGHIDYLVWYYANDDGDEDFPPSNLQEKYPNEDYMDNICEFIGRCTNLESLGLRATHYLDLQGLVWKPASTGLKHIYMHRAYIDFDVLKRLLSAADGEASNIVAMSLNFVELLDHTWKDVFDHLMRADAMRYLNISDLNYARFGESAEFRSYSYRPTTDTCVIWTENDADEEGLDDVVKKILDAGGCVSDNLDSQAVNAGYKSSDWKIITGHERRL
ncbi:hypothetical protein DM02DRAFT_611299 [Periconia macrospinosa]|uniref:Uncharacterized protein n=1 Tax=Periconia macrospinosa TaxID=97972 RepID=A0A2V1E5R5_9PLEO|nr:hypothetical protein DM02DRAFT_611299 [Periconia macrospinosa]